MVLVADSGGVMALKASEVQTSPTTDFIAEVSAVVVPDFYPDD